MFSPGWSVLLPSRSARGHRAAIRSPPQRSSEGQVVGLGCLEVVRRRADPRRGAPSQHWWWSTRSHLPAAAQGCRRGGAHQGCTSQVTWVSSSAGGRRVALKARGAGLGVICAMRAGHGQGPRGHQAPHTLQDPADCSSLGRHEEIGRQSPLLRAGLKPRHCPTAVTRFFVIPWSMSPGQGTGDRRRRSSFGEDGSSEPSRCAPRL